MNKDKGKQKPFTGSTEPMDSTESKPKKSISKKEFSLDDLKKELGASTTRYKPDMFLDCGEAFLDATGLQGPAMGHINMLLGHSNAGKTTALIAAAADAQKKGIMPIFLITEKKWSWEHAKLMGMKADLNSETGEWEGDFIYFDELDYVEQVTEKINKVLDAQDAGKLKRDICFFWDSVGSVPCKMTYEGKGGKQHTAGVLAEKINMGINQRINKTRKESSPYWAGLVICNLPWVQIPMTYGAHPKIKPKGGEAIYQCSTLVFRFGNEAESGISKIEASKNGRKINIATRSKVTVDKNHINGFGYKDSNIIITAHGFLKTDKRGGNDVKDGKQAFEQYKKDHMDYIVSQFKKEFGDDTNIDDVDIIETEGATIVDYNDED